MKKPETIEQNCQTVVQLKTVLPMADYLSDVNWIITTQRKLVFSLVCQENQEGVREIEVQPPLDIITSTCHDQGLASLKLAYPSLERPSGTQNIKHKILYFSSLFQT